ncbi:MAG: TIGR04283 family arsenosugar biosynthesis glycosyltransferase [Verrucomicrobiota bacterium]
MRISIIVPVLNEGPHIGAFLRRLRERAMTAEIIVVDGMSSDGTAGFAATLCDRLLQTAPGRAGQMNDGARVASGAVLWFLHADVAVPDTAISDIERALQDRQVVGGFFRIRLPGKRFIYRFTDGLAHYAGLALRIRCGDHGLFCRREIFEKVGGFPEVALMEDADFFRKLRRAGRIKVIPQRIVVSPRRYEAIGPARLTLAFGVIGFLYFLRAPRRVLQTLYRRLCSRS